MGSAPITKQDTLRTLQDWKDKSATNNKYVTADKVAALQKDLASLGIDTTSGDTYTDVRVLYDDAPENLLSQINDGRPSRVVDKQWGAALDDLILQVTNFQGAPTTDPAPTPTDTTTTEGTTPGSAGPIAYGDPGTVNPGFPSGTPVPGTGNKAVANDVANAIPADSDYRRMLQASDPMNVQQSSTAGEHGQLNTQHLEDTTSTNAELATKGGYTPISVNGGKEMVVVGKNAQIQLYDAATGKDLTSTLPFSAKAGDPSGTVVFGDGTRLDLKASDGATFVSGSTVTTVKDGQLSTVDGNDKVQQYLASTSRNSYNVAVELGDGSFAQTNGYDAEGKAQWVKADGNLKLSDGAGANDPALAAALNGAEPVDGIVNKEQSFALNPGYTNYIPALPANDGTPQGLSKAYEQVAMAGWTDDNSGAKSTRPQSTKEHNTIIGTSVAAGVLSFLPIGEFLGPVLGRIVSAASGTVRAGTEVGEASLATLGRASRGPRQERHLDDEGTHPANDPVPPYTDPPPAYTNPPPAYTA